MPDISVAVSRCRKRCSIDCLATRTFNQASTTVEYTACALVDLDLHSLPDASGLDIIGLRTQGS